MISLIDLDNLDPHSISIKDEILIGIGEETLEKRTNRFSGLIQEGMDRMGFSAEEKGRVQTKIDLGSVSLSPYCKKSEEGYDIVFPAIFVLDPQDPICKIFREKLQIFWQFKPFVQGIKMWEELESDPQLFEDALQFVCYHELVHIASRDPGQKLTPLKWKIIEKHTDIAACAWLGTSRGAIYFFEGMQKFFPNCPDPTHPTSADRVSILSAQNF